MNKVLLTTVFSGFNYGSSLQAFAGKTILEEMGCSCELVALKSLVRGRDIRINKLLTIFGRSILTRGSKNANSIKVYQKSYRKVLIGDSTSRFADFTDKYLKPQYFSWNRLKKLSENCDACFAGSDQIWNSSTLYVDPLYYLRFASPNRRVALAPSFGRDFIADYNKKKMGKWISEFAHLSVREDSGVQLIKELTGKDATHLVDPTLMLDGNTWKEKLGIKDRSDNYILAYFLDKPSENAKKAICELKEYLNCEVVAIPYQFDDMSYCDKFVPTGPIEFLDLVNNAKCVLTDSFHGTAFSINLHTPFYVFRREYGAAHSQNSRIDSILKKMKMTDRYEPSNVIQDIQSVDFDYSENVLSEERQKARNYVTNALNNNLK